jgi:hypothetical protein
MLVVDASSNATEGNDNEVDWANIEQAIDEFAKAPLHAGSSAGLTLLPRPLSPGSDSVSCLPEDYATPELGLTPLPSEKFFSVLHGAGSMRWAGADVPLPAALRGSISGLESNADWNLPVAAVLVAAGLFSGCGDEPITTDAITDAAIYVMGVGSWLADASRAPWSLRYWSKQTFGRATAHIGTSLEELRQTLEQFWLFAGSCSFKLPKAALQPDARLFATQDGVEQQLNENPSCDAPGSYFVDDASDTGASEVTLHLCESDCSSLAHQAALGSLGLRWETCAQ